MPTERLFRNSVDIWYAVEAVTPVNAEQVRPRARPAGLLLTGGASRRMRRAKAKLMIDGVSLAARTAGLLGQVADPVIEVGPGYTSLAQTRESPAGAGPLAAMAAGWAALLTGIGPAAPPTAVLVIATDLPRLTIDLLAWLAGAAAGDHSVVPLDDAGRSQPLCARYSPAAMATACELVAAGERSMHALLDRIDVTYLPAPDPAALTDVDTPDDLAAITKHANRRT